MSIRNEAEIIESWKEDSFIVSIICNTYNHVNYISQTIESFLEQRTRFGIEILIHDDASTDGTSQVIRKFENEYPAIIKPIYQSENQYSKGIKPAFEYQYPRAKDKYVALCEGDDFWTDPLKLQKQIDYLEENPQYSICCTNYSEVNSKGVVLKENVWRGNRLNPVITHEMILEEYKPKFLTSVFRREAIKNGVPPLFYKAFNTDNFLCAIATEYGPACFLNFTSGCYRVHNQGVWSSKTEIQQFEMQLKSFLVMAEYFSKDYQKKSITKRIYSIKRKLSRLYLKEKNISKSMDQIRYMFPINPADTVKVVVGNLLSIVK
ncbi:Glycosyl transferase family 2 [Algoriphagus locisalis]|uniref:Glycosyl transferase family 2 n=1 Tax=Algoriphagus locisalis TaxID=305507 RepID=A0A1I6XNG5_9BACT|nr:glycosyltransferase [Algoriphagus locisalis]SFT39830.1 Glycosyl transferase family 2 [Algoriphagus locisalis]